MNKNRPYPIYLHGTRSMANNRDRRNLMDLQHASRAALLRLLPAGEITYKR